MKLTLLEGIVPNKVYLFLKNLVNKKNVSLNEVVMLYEYMYGHIAGDDLWKDANGILDLYEHFSRKVDDKEGLADYIIGLSVHPSWIASLVLVGKDLGDDFADRSYKFKSEDTFRQVLQSLINKEWGAMSILIQDMLNANIDYFDNIGNSNPELMLKLADIMDNELDDIYFNKQKSTNQYSFEALQKYGPIKL